MDTASPASFEALVDAALRGEISLDHAIASAAPPRFSDALDLEQVVMLGKQGRGLAANGQWHEAVARWLILVAAVGPRPDGRLGFHRYQVAVADLAFIATEAVKDIPDGSLFELAVDHASRAFGYAGNQDDDYWREMQLSRLGAIHFLPYTIRLNRTDDGAALRWWQQRGRDALGEGFVPMPEPRAALETACDYFRAMLQIPGGTQRGFALKCLAQALSHRRDLGDQGIDPAEIVDLARQALPELADKPDWQIELHSLLQVLGEEADLAGAVEQAGDTTNQRVQENAIEDHLAALRGAAQVDPRMAVELAERIWPEAATSEARRIEIASLYGTAAFALLEPLGLFPESLATAPKLARFETADATLRPHLAAAGVGDAARVQALLGLAAVSGEYDAEARGLALVEEATALDAALSPALSEIAAVLAAMLAVGEGVNQWSAVAYLPAAQRYFHAAALCSLAKLADRARDVLGRGVEALERAGRPVDYDAVLALAAIAPGVEASDPGDTIAQVLSALWNGYLSDALAAQVDPGFAFLVLQAAKGAQFSVALDEARRWSIDDDAPARELLDERSRLLKDAPRGQPPLVSREDTEFFLASGDAPKQRAGATVAERVANLERGFDALVQARTAAAVEPSTDYLVGIEEAFELLDERTALLVVHAGRTPAGHMTNRLFLVTKNRRAIFGQNDLGPAISVPFGVLLNEVAVDDMGVTIGSARTAIFDEEALVDASGESEGAGLLRLLGRALLGGLAPTLDALEAEGIDHLAIWPHGSTHFLPWHLLPVGEAILADRFVVTYLPSLGLLRPRPDPANRARDGLEAFGATFAGTKSPLPAVRTELEGIARASGARVHLDSPGMEAGLLDAFGHARWLHVATHGKQNAGAPAFHRILLTRDAANDGVVHAYELLAHDLRGLELVTLSACETALGRVDRGDNLRGFPAALFQAGAETIIGTLWPVLDTAAALFFETFYARLAGGDDKLTSFAEAQRATRHAHPQFRDWGAFHFSGRW